MSKYISKHTEFLINKHVEHARTKHPFFCKNSGEMMCLLMEEIGEMAQAINENKVINIQEEALDAIAVLVRFLEGD